MCSESIPSVTEKSVIFIKELSFPQTAPTDDAFFNRDWVGACRGRWAGPGLLAGWSAGPWIVGVEVGLLQRWSASSGCGTPLQKQERRGVSEGFHRWGGLVFIVDDHDNFPNWIMILNSMFPNLMMTLNSMFPSRRMI